MSKRARIIGSLVILSMAVLPGPILGNQDSDEYDKVPYKGLNGTFDRGIGGWSNYCHQAEPPVAEKKETKAGAGALKMIVPQGGSIHLWQSLEVGRGKNTPAVGDRPVGSFHVKIGRDVSPVAGKTMLFKVEAYSAAAGKTVLGALLLTGDEPKEEWLYFQTSLGEAVPRGAETVTVAFENDLPGTFYVDEVNVYKTVPLP